MRMTARRSSSAWVFSRRSTTRGRGWVTFARRSCGRRTALSRPPQPAMGIRCRPRARVCSRRAFRRLGVHRERCRSRSVHPRALARSRGRDRAGRRATRLWLRVRPRPASLARAELSASLRLRREPEAGRVVQRCASIRLRDDEPARASASVRGRHLRRRLCDLGLHPSNRPLQHRWMRELERVMAPDGVAIITTKGLSRSNVMSDAERERFLPASSSSRPADTRAATCALPSIPSGTSENGWRDGSRSSSSFRPTGGVYARCHSARKPV